MCEPLKQERVYFPRIVLLMLGGGSTGAQRLWLWHYTPILLCLWNVSKSIFLPSPIILPPQRFSLAHTWNFPLFVLNCQRSTHT